MFKYSTSYVTHGKNDFAEVSKILGRYRFENNFVKLSNYYRRSS